MTKLWRGTHPDRPSDGTCWAPDPCSALSFLTAGGLDGRGVLLEATLEDEAVAVTECKGMVERANFGFDENGHDAVFAADSPTYRKWYAQRGWDWLVYPDAPAKSLWWHWKRQAVVGNFQIDADRIHLDNFICWRVVSAAGRAALTVDVEHKLDDDALKRFVLAQYPTCDKCGQIPDRICRALNICTGCIGNEARERFAEAGMLHGGKVRVCTTGMMLAAAEGEDG